MGSSIHQAVKNPNVLQIAAMEGSNILLVLSVSVPQTLVKHTTFTLSASVPTFNRNEAATNSESESPSYFSSYQYCCTVCAETLQMAVIRSPHPALVHSEVLCAFHLSSIISRLKQ